jgi:hypothetical protein
MGRSNAPTSTQLADRFMITHEELKSRTPDTIDQGFAHLLSSQLPSHPLVIVGWRAAEPMLGKQIQQTVAGLPAKPRISIINRSFDPQHHKRLTDAYHLTPEEAHFAVAREGCPTTDDLFLWIQALYAMACLREHVTDPSDSPAIDAWIATLTHPYDAGFLMSFVDDFLPAWMRLCWRAGLVSCRGFEPHQLDLLLKPEVHVPWDVPNIDRPDLAAAARLLSMLPADGKPWECERFPGALWDPDRLRLVVPLPAWGFPDDLNALQPLLAALQRDLAFVSQLAILPLAAGNERLSSDDVNQLRSSVAGLIRRPGFAQADQIQVQHSL